MSKRTEHTCVIREEIEATERELAERELPADDVLEFDIAIRVLLLKKFADQVIVPLPSIVLDPVTLHDKFVAWTRARVALDETDKELNGEEAFDELIRSKRQLERYVGFLRNRAKNAVEIAHEVRETPRLESIVRELRADVMKYPDSYASGGGVIPYIVLTVFAFSRYLKTTL